LLIAHGSRQPTANQEVQALAARLDAEGVAERVEACFLELAEPDLCVASAALVGAGAHEIRVLPLFLNQGRHVGRDLPALVEVARRQFPEVRFSLLPHVGAAEGYAALVRECADEDPISS